MRRSRAMRFAMLLAFVPQIAIAGAGFWSSSGPSGGVVYDVEINPATPTTLYASTRGGIFKSIDGGLSWARAQNGIVGSAGYNFRIVLDRDAPDTLYTFDASGRLYRTTDGAANWALTGYVLPTGVQAQDFADVPGSTTNLFLATSDFSGSATATGGLLRSTNAGASFAPAGTGLPAGRNFAAVAVDPTTPAVVLAGVDDFEHPSAGAQPAIYRSSDGGATWTSAFASPDPDFTPGVPAISFGPGLRVYASGEFATLLRSDDDGASWSNIGTNAQRVLAHPTLADTVFIANSQGFLRSTSGGTAPVVLNTGASPNATYTSTLAGAAPVPPFVNGIVADPAFPAAGTSLWLTGDGSGLLRSLDAAAGGAVTWTTAHEGLVATNVRALLAHPLGGGRLYAGFGDIFTSSPALFVRPTAVASWGTSNNGLRAAQLRALVIDPTTAGTVASSVIYAAGRESIQLGNGYRNAGIYKSSNGGASWSTIAGGLPTITSGGATFPNMGTFRSVALDPRSCASPPPPGGPTGPVCTSGPLNTVYATAAGNGVLAAGVRTFGFRVIKSTNGGASWTDTSTALQPSTLGPADQAAQVTPVPVVLDPNDSNRIWIGTFANIAGTPTPDPQNGVFLSTDGGATWTHRSNGLPRRPGATNTALDVLSLAIHPTNSQILWASTLNSQAPAGTGSIYKTVDGGATWVQSATGLTPGADIRAILVDPANPLRVYASGAGTESNPGSVFRSNDGGVTWQSFSIGLPADAALALARDPLNPTLVYAGTNTGVWEIEQVADSDGDGVPNATENNAPGGGDGNFDTLPDAQQPSVGSAVVLFNRDAESGTGGSGGFFTSDVVSGTGGACSQAVDVQATVAARHGNDPVTGVPGASYAYPRDLVRFEILDCAHAVVDVTFHNANFTVPGWTFRFFGPQQPGNDATIGWYDFSSRAQRTAPNKWRLTLDANQFGSYRPVPNAILFEGGPACYSDAQFKDGFEDGATPAGCN